MGWLVTIDLSEKFAALEPGASYTCILTWLALAYCGAARQKR